MRREKSCRVAQPSKFSRMSMHVGVSLFFDNSDLTPCTLLNGSHGNHFTNTNLKNTEKPQFHPSVLEPGSDRRFYARTINIDIYSPTMFIAVFWDGGGVLAEGVGRSPCRHQVKNICVCLRVSLQVLTVQTRMCCIRGFSGLDGKYKGATPLMVVLHADTCSTGCSQR